MRCRKAHWYLSARCDGTLSERQRVRLEAHLASCEECRREAFYFSEIGSLATRMESHSTQPDFNLRLRAAVRRADEAAAHPVSWQSRLSALLLRPSLVAASIVVLGIGGLGAWSMMKGPDAPEASNSPASSEVSAQYGLPVGYSTTTVKPSGELIPITGNDEETQKLRKRYLEAGRLPHDYVLGGEPVSDPDDDSSAMRFVMPTVSSDQVAKKVSY